MSVNRISQSHATQADATHGVASQKVQGGGSKTTATQQNAAESARAEQQQRQAAAESETESNVGKEQAAHDAENVTKGKRVNVLA